MHAVPRPRGWGEVGWGRGVLAKDWCIIQEFDFIFRYIMALSAAERQRHYMEKRDSDPDRRAKFLKQQRERYQSDNKLGRRKLVPCGHLLGKG